MNRVLSSLKKGAKQIRKILPTSSKAPHNSSALISTQSIPTLSGAKKQRELEDFITKLAFDLSIDSALLYLIDPNSGQPFFFSSYGLNSSFSHKSEVQSWKGLTWRVIKKRDVVSIPDIWEDSHALTRKRLFQAENFVTYQGVPLCYNGRTIGVLEVYTRDKRCPELSWFLQLRDVAATLSSLISTNTYPDSHI